MQGWVIRIKFFTADIFVATRTLTGAVYGNMLQHPQSIIHSLNLFWRMYKSIRNRI
jgi:hypothetical protein